MSRLFVRHAQSYANQTGVLAPEFLGSNLSPLGHQQAESSASYIRGIVPECIKITSSPHVRCMQTAQHIAANLGVEEIKIDDTLGVRFLGDALGRDGAYRRGYSTYDEIPNSESTRDFLQRIFPYTLENDNGYGQEANAAEIIVTHSGVISASGTSSLIAYLSRRYQCWDTIAIERITINTKYQMHQYGSTQEMKSIWYIQKK